MARYLAVDWDDFECRYLLATLQKGTWKIQKVGAVSLDETVAERPSTEEGEGGETPPKTPAERFTLVTESLKTALKEQRIEPAPVLLGLGRNQVEMYYLTLPPSPEAEIPGMLKNQLLRESPGFSEYDPLDYLTLGDGGDESLRLLALTIPLSFRQTLVRSFRGIGRNPQRIGFRPLDAARLLADSDLAPEQFEPGLVVDLVGSEVDLVLLEGRRVVSVRSLRLPDSLNLEESFDRIADELERSVMIAAEGLSSESIRKLYLFGTEEDWQPLTERLQQGRPWEITVVNPFHLPGYAASSVPESPGRFAPLLGLLAEQRDRSRDTIDLLHPKEAAKPTNYLRAAVMAVLLLLVCGFGVFHWNRGVIQGLESERAKLEEEYKEALAGYQQIYPIYAVLQNARTWDTDGVAWLDELRDLSLVVPGEQDLVLSQISFTGGPVNNDRRYRGTIRLSGMVRDTAVLLNLDQALRAQGRYLMQSPTTSPNPAGGGYPWRFTTVIYRLNR